jgi:hypothetical protein
MSLLLLHSEVRPALTGRAESFSASFRADPSFVFLVL